MAFEGLSEKLQATFKKIRGKGKVSEKDIKDAMREVRMALLEADVNFKVAKELINKISEKALGAEVLESLTPAQQIIKIVRDELTELMGGGEAKLPVAPKPPTVILMAGLNGAGKTTVLKVLSGIEKPYRGKIKLLGKNIKDYRGNELHFHNVALLPQNVHDVFLRDTVESDLRDMCRVLGYSAVQADEKMSAVSEKLGISRLFGKHPYDLSGGEAQKCALAKVLLSGPKILLLDEPTKGIDAHAKLILRDILFSLKREGVTVIAVTHDTEFAAIASDKCALFFDGEVISPSSPRNFFSGNDFYTTAASRISRGIFENTVTVDDVVLLAKGEAHS